MPLKECANHHLFNGDKYGDTCPHCGLTLAPPPDEKEKSPEQINDELRLKENERVCGWLVCIRGVNEGKSYPIKSGKNFIGAADTMDIQILGDRYVDYSRHATIVYDPKKAETVLLPGESMGLVYLEQNAVYASKKLDPYARIDIGETTLLFVPFCGEYFNWEQN